MHWILWMSGCDLKGCLVAELKLSRKSNIILHYFFIRNQAVCLPPSLSVTLKYLARKREGKEAIHIKRDTTIKIKIAISVIFCFLFATLKKQNILWRHKCSALLDHCSCMSDLCTNIPCCGRGVISSSAAGERWYGRLKKQRCAGCQGSCGQSSNQDLPYLNDTGTRAEESWRAVQLELKSTNKVVHLQ